MKNAKNKTMAILIALLMITSMLATFSTLPIGFATDYNNYAYISVAPNPVGVGQSVIAVFFLTIPSPNAIAGFNATNNFNNYNVKITSPSLKAENFGPYTSDATGGAFLSYTPNEVGQYKFDFTFPGQTIVKGSATFNFKPASATTNLTVQQEPVTSYQTPPLPTGYWTRPIYGENRGWYQIGGNWLRATYNGTGPFNPYTTAPNTAHIVWTKNQYMGGVVGGDYGDLNYYQAPTYQSYFVPPVIISGRLYYMERQVPGSGWVGLHCLDIRTGNELWFRDVSKIGGAGAGGGAAIMNIYGQVFDAEGVNGHGEEAFIWNLGANWTVFDANSGNLVYTVINPPTGTTTNSLTPLTSRLSGPNLLIGGVDPRGSIIAYYIDGANNWLLKWNSTQLLINNGINPISNLYLPPFGAVINWSKGIEWNVTIPDRAGTPGFYLGVPPCDGEVVFAQTADISNAADTFTLTAYSAKDGHELWYNDFKDVFVPGSTIWEFFVALKDSVLVVFDKNTMRLWGFNAQTGQKMWGPTDPFKNAWDTEITAVAAYGKLYVGTYSGRIYCYDLKTGALQWTYLLSPSGYETPYGTYPVSYISNAPGAAITVADGKLYAVTGEHTPNSPYWLGGAMYVVNATTGEGIYKMSGWWSGSAPAIADGYALNHNCYDGSIYSFGKGQTTTTVSASPEVSVQGNSVLIKGTVMDESPGAIDYAGNNLNTAGSAAIADEFMTQWMEYLYQQKPMPNNATGVTINLDVIDANNNFRNIGTTTSDASGAFSYMWKPDIPGKYTVIASFAGSESYYPSSSETAFGVTETASATATPATLPISVADTYFVPAIAGIIVVIIIGFVVLALLMLRKKP